MTIKYSKIASYTLFLMLVLPNFISSNAYTLLIIAVALFWFPVSAKGFPRNYFKAVWPLLLLLLLGGFGLVNHETYDVFKDAWYVFKPVMLVAVGMLLGGHFFAVQPFIRVVVLSAVTLSLSHLIVVYYYWNIGYNLFEIRDEGVRGYFLAAVGLAILCYYWKTPSYIAVSRKLYVVASVVLSLSLLLSLSRTMMLSFVLVVIYLFELVRPNFRNIMKMIGGIFIIFIVAASIDNLEVAGETNFFVSKISNSFNEMIIQDYYTEQDVNMNWRGYESYLALNAYWDGSVLEILIGKGLGTLIDLGFYMNLGGEELRYIPILHNGYLYVLLKFGIIGLLSYLYFILFIIKNRAKAFVSDGGYTLRNISSSMGFCLLFTTFSVAGPFNKVSMDSAVLIAFAAWVLIKKLRESGNENKI